MHVWPFRHATEGHSNFCRSARRGGTISNLAKLPKWQANMILPLRPTNPDQKKSFLSFGAKVAKTFLLRETELKWTFIEAELISCWFENWPKDFWAKMHLSDRSLSKHIVSEFWVVLNGRIFFVLSFLTKSLPTTIFFLFFANPISILEFVKWKERKR